MSVSRLIFRLIAAMITILVIILAVVGSVGTGKFLLPSVVLAACGIFWFLEFDFQTGTTAFALQHLITQSAIALIVPISGLYIIYLGVSELASPITFSRHFNNVAAEVVRELIGTEGLATLFFIFGIVVLFQGLRMFSGLASLTKGNDSNLKGPGSS